MFADDSDLGTADHILLIEVSSCDERDPERLEVSWCDRKACYLDLIVGCVLESRRVEESRRQTAIDERYHIRLGDRLHTGHRGESSVERRYGLLQQRVAVRRTA